MIPIEKYAQAAASTARTPPNSPARRAALEAENAARVAAEQSVKGLEAERDALRARLDVVIRAWDSLPGGRRHGISDVQSWLVGPMKAAIDSARDVHPTPAQAVPDGTDSGAERAYCESVTLCAAAVGERLQITQRTKETPGKVAASLAALDEYYTPKKGGVGDDRP